MTCFRCKAPTERTDAFCPNCGAGLAAKAPTLAPVRSVMNFALAFQLIGLVALFVLTLMIALAGAARLEADHGYWSGVNAIFWGDLFESSVLVLAAAALTVLSFLVVVRMLRVSGALASDDPSAALGSAKTRWLVLSYVSGGFIAGLLFMLARGRLKMVEPPAKAAPAPGNPAPGSPRFRPMSWTRSMPREHRGPALATAAAGALLVGLIVVVPTVSSLGALDDFEAWHRPGVVATYATEYYGPNDEVPRERGLIEHRIMDKTGYDDGPRPTAWIVVSVTGPDPLRLEGTWNADEIGRRVNQAPHTDQEGTVHWLWIDRRPEPGGRVWVFDRPFTADDSFIEHDRVIVQLSVVTQDSSGFRADLLTYYSDLLLLRSLDVDLEDGGRFRMEPHSLTGGGPSAPVVLIALLVPSMIISVACYGSTRIRRDAVRAPEDHSTSETAPPNQAIR